MKHKIFYHPENDLVLADYGIEIPVAGDRALKVFQSLQGIDASLKYLQLEQLPAITPSDLMLAHHGDYVARLFGTDEELTRELMTCFELVNPDGSFNRYSPTKARKNLTAALQVILRRVATTYLSTKSALECGFAYHLGGGMHHAMSFGGRGFGLLNDIVISLRKLQNEGRIKSAWVVDVDAHKGDGTSELTRDDPSITTLSIHMEKGWPLDAGTDSDPWFIPSNIDIGISAAESGSYLDKLSEGLQRMEREFALPDVVIVVNGADPFEFDELPSSQWLKLSKEQMLKRDMLIYEFFKGRHVPQSFVMAGGYGQRSWEIYSQFLKTVLFMEQTDDHQ